MEGSLDMFTYALDDSGGAPLFEKLCSLLREDIRRRSFRPGDKLPSKRALAKNLGVSVITVESAYAQLIAEGYVRTIQKKGYYVCDIPEICASAAPSVSAPVGPRRPAPRIDLTAREIDPALIPFDTCMKVIRSVMRNRDGLVLSSPPEGKAELHRAIADHLRTFRGMSVSPDQIVVGGNTEYLYGLIAQLFGPGKRFGVEDPGFTKIAQVYRAHGREVSMVRVDEHGLQVDRIGDAQVIHTLPSHHFPTGTIMPISRRYELLSWAVGGEERYIIEDDYDSELRLTGRPIPSLTSIDADGRVIYINTFARTLTPTVGVSYMVLPPALMERFRRDLGFYSCTVTTFDQNILADLLEQGEFERHIIRMRSLYTRKRNALIAGMRESGLMDVAEISGEETGLHFLLRFAPSVSGDRTAERLREAEIEVARVSDYSSTPTEDEQRTFVICYAALSDCEAASVGAEIARCVAR